MSGVLHGMLLGTSGGIVFSGLVTIEVSAAAFAGYNDGSFGSIDNDQTTEGDTIEDVYSDFALPASDADLILNILPASGMPSQDYYTKVEVEDGDGNIRTFLTADATFNSGATQWSWGDGNTPVWDSGDGSKVRRVTIYK